VTQSLAEDFTFFGYYFGITIISVIAYILIASELFPKTNHALLQLVLSALLVRFVTANIFATEFLWIIPLLIVWGTVSKKPAYVAFFHFIMALYLFAFYAGELSANGTGFLFIPSVFVPTGLIQALQLGSVLEDNLSLQVRSLLSGYCLALVGLIAWPAIRSSSRWKRE